MKLVIFLKAKHLLRKIIAGVYTFWRYIRYTASFQGHNFLGPPTLGPHLSADKLAKGVNGKDSVPFFHWEKQNSYIFFLNDHIGLAFCKPFRVVFDTFFNDNSRLQLLLQYLTKINATFFFVQRKPVFPFKQ